MKSDQKVALVTGSRRGIGFGVAKELAKHGYNLIINGVSPEALGEEAAKELRQEGVDVRYVLADIATQEGRLNLVNKARTHFGRVDLLVNNAGVAPKARVDLLEMEEGSFDRLLFTNLKGPFFLTQLVAKRMIEEKKKNPESDFKIVNISSVSAYVSSINRGEYCMSKAGVSMMTKLYAHRLADEGINVYEIRPGIIRTDMTGAVAEKYDKEIADGITPIRRWGTPEDIGKAVTAIALGYFPFSTGEVINVDGGFHIQRL